MTPDNARRVSAETLGTAFLLAAVVGSGIMAAKLAGGNGAVALLCNTLPTGSILVVLILIFGPVSGAHAEARLDVIVVGSGKCIRSTCKIRLNGSSAMNAPVM